VIWTSLNYAYKLRIVKHNSINDFTKVHFLHFFVQRHVSAVVTSLFRLITFLSKVKVTISNTIVTVIYEISYNI